MWELCHREKLQNLIIKMLKAWGKGSASQFCY